jgi:hypothetical protein
MLRSRPRNSPRSRMRAACGDFSAACRYTFAAAVSGVEAASLKGTKNALASGALRAPLHPRDFVAMLAASDVEPTRFSTRVAFLRPPNGRAAHPSASPRVPRSGVMKPAGQEALQRRVHERAAVGCSGVLDGDCA